MRYNYDSFENCYQPRVAQKVVGLAFLNVVSAWDEFVEHLFLGYMAGGNAPTGFAPQLSLGPCRNRTHAARVIGAAVPGDAQRLLRWNDWSWVTQVAKVYFRDGEPFTSIKEPFIARFQDAQIVRNRVAHSSLKARRQFKRRVNPLIGKSSDAPLPRGFTPGEFLARIPAEGQFPKFDVYSADSHTWGDFFECYVSMFFEATAVLCPAKF